MPKNNFNVLGTPPGSINSLKDLAPPPPFISPRNCRLERIENISRELQLPLLPRLYEMFRGDHFLEVDLAVFNNGIDQLIQLVRLNQGHLIENAGDAAPAAPFIGPIDIPVDDESDNESGFGSQTFDD
jgi:hypothetical protein